MIPKIIHYCWFGKGPLPEDVKSCIASWKKYCPDYEIKEWNEGNFDLNCCHYVKEAYEAKKWAFVTDVVRLFVLANEGGIYMDTDVEVIRPLDELLLHHAFLGFESDEMISTGIMAAEEKHPFFQRLLNQYEERHFVRPDGSLDLTTNVVMITGICAASGFKTNNTLQTLNQLTLYPKDFFSPKSYDTGVINVTNNTYTIHHFSGSWQSREVLLNRKLIEILCKLVGNKYGLVIGKFFSVFLRAKQRLNETGLKNTIYFYIQKVRRTQEKKDETLDE